MSLPTKARAIIDELAALYREHGGIDPRVAVEWARAHPGSALHSRLEWDDTAAAEKYRISQMRQIIVEVKVTYPDGVERQIYVSPVEVRGQGGYVAMVDVMGDEEKRARFLAQALAEYEALGAKYRDLDELAKVQSVVAQTKSKVTAKVTSAARKKRAA